MIKSKLWKGEDLKGQWEVTLKIDGVRMLRDDAGNPVSRSGKPLYNLDHLPKEITDAEIYAGDWERSISLVRTSVNGRPVRMEHVYPLDPIDDRLAMGTYEDPTSEFLSELLSAVVGQGYEGLVIRKGKQWLKVKPKESADVRITGIQPGTGKHEGKLGAFLTEHGKVGTGFTDEQREELNSEEYIGAIAEVEYMHVTPNNKMRHPRFIRIREDKSTETLPWEETYDSGDNNES